MISKAVGVVTDHRFLLGLAVGWLVVPYASNAIKMRRMAAQAPPAHA